MEKTIAFENPEPPVLPPSPEQLFHSIPTDGAPWKLVRWKNNYLDYTIDYIGELNAHRVELPEMSNDAVIISANILNDSNNQYKDLTKNAIKMFKKQPKRVSAVILEGTKDEDYLSKQGKLVRAVREFDSHHRGYTPILSTANLKTFDQGQNRLEINGLIPTNDDKAKRKLESYLIKPIPRKR